jgi:glucosyl-3-phosphoglycerate phosphatase
MASPQARSSASLRNSVLGSTARGSKSLGFLSCFPQDDERNQHDFDPPRANRIQPRVFCYLRDPGIWDPHLTDLGRRQAAAVAQALRPSRLRKLISSPYARALETAGIIAEHLGLPITVEPLIAERFFFTCDIGSPLAELRARWPDVGFNHLRDPWWPQLEETEEAIVHRSETFRRQIAKDVWSDIAVVSHWGFIRALTGLKVPNGSVLRVDPTRPDREAEMVLIPETD